MTVAEAVPPTTSAGDGYSVVRWGTIIAAGMFFQIPAMSLTISAVAVLIFSMYLLYDVSNIVRGGETHEIKVKLEPIL